MFNYKKDEILLKLAKDSLIYDGYNGHFISKLKNKKRSCKNGIISVPTGKAGGLSCSAIRIAWLLTYGSIKEGCVISFIDGNKQNIKISNLKEVSIYERNKYNLNRCDNSIIPYKINQILGKKFGRLTANKFSYIRESKVKDNRNDKYYNAKRYYIECFCECDAIKNVEYFSLTTGNCKSCGCDNGSAKRLKYKDAFISNAMPIYKFYKFKNFPGNLTFEQFIDLTQRACHYCGLPPSNISVPNTKFIKKTIRRKTPFIYSGLDRLDPLRNHDFDNCVPCCITCNYAKSNKTYNEFMEWIMLLVKKYSNK